MVDNFPVASQVKSLVQFICGDRKGARLTQKHFINESPIVGDVTYLVKRAKGDLEGAKKTRLLCNQAWGNTANAVPILGHVMSATYYTLHDKPRAKAALQSANRGSVLMAAGLLSGPMGPIIAPLSVIVSAIAYDSVDSLVSHQGKGLIGMVEKAVVEPELGTVLDAMVIPVIYVTPVSVNPIRAAVSVIPK